MEKPASLTQEILKSLLTYDRNTGIFVWLSNRGKAKKGSVAGHIERDGYVRVGVLKHHYQSHRLAFLYEFGHFPIGEVDHINGIRHDNRIENLRLVDSTTNARNRRISVRNTSGITGVYWNNKDKRWVAQIWVHSEKIHIGSYVQVKDAISARKQASDKYGFHENHGDRRSQTFNGSECVAQRA